MSVSTRPEVGAFTSYQLPTEPEIPLRAKLDFNESPFDVPEEIKARVVAALLARRWSEYPEFGAPRLRGAIAKATGRSLEEIVVGNGSGEVLHAAVTVFAGSGGTLVLPTPTFSLYDQMAVLAGARILRIPRVGPGFDVDESAFLAAPEGAIPLVTSPNNPTGGVVSRRFVRALAARYPVVLLDQAYVDFAEPEDDLLPLVDELPNLAVFRTLSKAYSAAGFRIGYAVASTELAREIQKGVLPFSVDLAAEELALALLADGETAEKTVRVIRAERDGLAAALTALGLAVAPARGNFLYFAVGGASRVRRHLLERGVKVRDLSGHLRVTVGTPEENQIFLSALKECL
ncbi:MAG: histidinol-phosphate aminotransferase family protein [Acidobacteria bacterium]|nr:histidinol-phosphate aminotransferase family protein [Acidobacteriota bacterium]